MREGLRCAAHHEMKKPWNDESGDWHDLDGPLQAVRYRTIARLVASVCQGWPRSILDVGCGQGILRDYLLECDYFGIEPSRIAARAASARSGQDHIFCGVAAEFGPNGRTFSVVVFNEMLYYTPDPVAILCKFAPLAPVFIVSIFQRRLSVKEWLEHRVNRSMTNVGCTRLILKFAANHGWTIESDELVENRWRIFAMRPPPVI